MTWPAFMRRLLTFAASLMLAAALAAALVCWAPGTGIDEAEFGAQSSAAAETLRRERARDASVVHVYTGFWRGLATGDWGYSHAFNRPVAGLFAERMPVTISLVATGWALAWLAGLAAAALGLRGPRARLLPLTLVTVLVCLPSAVLALGCALAGWPAALALAAAVAPKVFSYSDEILHRGRNGSHRLMAIARGVPAGRVFWTHLVRPAFPEFRALAAVTLPLAIGAAIPVEVFTDTPGIGQLAWKAATARDATLLLHLTVLLTAVTLAGSMAAEGQNAKERHA